MNKPAAKQPRYAQDTIQRRSICADTSKHWMPEQDSILRLHYRNAPLDEIQVLLEKKKSISAIQKRARRMGLKRDRKSKARDAAPKVNPEKQYVSAEYPESKQYGYIRIGERLVVPQERRPFCNSTTTDLYLGAELSYRGSA